MDEVREVMRLHHCSIHTERSYCDWIKRFILFQNSVHRHNTNDPAGLRHNAFDDLRV